MRIAVVTPSIPTRSQQLCRAIDSVNQQSLPADEHLIIVDYACQGPARLRNQMIQSTTCDWIAFLDDDDRLDSHHLHTLAQFADEADVVIPYCRFDGPPLPNGYYNREFDGSDLASHGCFPITVLVRRDAIAEAGLFSPEAVYEDWNLWNVMMMKEARFKVVPTVTWTYQTNDRNRRTNLQRRRRRA